ncbi:MAG: hypothetical protein LBQ61_04755, partial [Spirochaetales bacterium]|nr:hypothetical protein [Spirochaetales bacterium]
MDKAKGNSGKAGGPGFFDLLIILFCTAGTFFCLYLFYNDFTRTLSKQAESPVGTISYKYRAAQRRFEDRVLWDRLQQDSPVYNGDFVRTSGLSEATVSFSGGVAVDIAENSLIQITSENTVPRVEVNQGGIDIKAQDSMILIVSKGRRIEVSGGSVISARSGPGDQVDLMVIQGAAAIMNGQEITHAGPGEAFAVGENTLEATPRLIALRPYPNELILSPDSQGCPVDFLFSTSGSSLILTLEISSSRSFSQVQTLRVENSQARAVLRPGIWWWRAYPADDPQGG